MRCFAGRNFLNALCLATALLAAAPLAAAPAQQAETPAAEGEFVRGTITGDNVNVRHGPGTEYPIYYRAPMGAEVRVVGRDGQWLEVEFPARGFSWLSSDYVSMIDDDTAIVTGSQVNVRGGPGLQFDELYRVQANHKFKVLDTDVTGRWHRVEPMPDATAWVISDYVRLAGPIPGVTPPTVDRPVRPTPEPARPPERPIEPERPTPAPGYYESKMTEAEEALTAEIEKEDPAQWELDEITEMFTDLADNADDPIIRTRARARLAQLRGYEALKAHAMDIGRVDEMLAQRLADLERRRQQEIGITERVAPAHLATGRIERFHIRGMGGATHKLLRDDGGIAWLLRSDVIDLSDYEDRNCGVRGSVVSVPGVRVPIIEVTGVTPLTGRN